MQRINQKLLTVIIQCFIDGGGMDPIPKGGGGHSPIIGPNFTENGMNIGKFVDIFSLWPSPCSASVCSVRQRSVMGKQGFSTFF